MLRIHLAVSLRETCMQMNATHILALKTFALLIHFRESLTKLKCFTLKIILCSFQGTSFRQSLKASEFHFVKRPLARLSDDALSTVSGAFEV